MNWEKEIIKLVGLIKNRPEVFFGRNSIFDLFVFLDGYCEAASLVGGEEVMHGFSNFVYAKYKIFHPQIDVPFILNFYYGGDSINKLHEMLIEFFQTRKNIGVDGLSAWADNVIIREYGGPYGAPEDILAEARLRASDRLSVWGGQKK